MLGGTGKITEVGKVESGQAAVEKQEEDEGDKVLLVHGGILWTISYQ